MILRLSASCLGGVWLVLLSGCAPLTVENGAVVLQPTRTATYKLEEKSIDFFCGLDTAPIPPTIDEEDLRPGEVGTGFKNWHRSENLCGRRYSWVLQGLVAFDAQPLRDLGRAVAIQSATLRLTKRRLHYGDPPRPARWVSDGLESTNCPELRIPSESWERGWHEVAARADLIETEPFIAERTLYLDLPGDGEREYDVTRWVKRLLRGPSRPFEVAFESTSDKRYQNNNELCLHIVGAFSLEVAYQKIVRAEP